MALSWNCGKAVVVENTTMFCWDGRCHSLKLDVTTHPAPRAAFLPLLSYRPSLYITLGVTDCQYDHQIEVPNRRRERD